MKTTKFLAIIALLSLVCCDDVDKIIEYADPIRPNYCRYNPDDTIDNGLYWNLLRLDSAVVDYTLLWPKDSIFVNANNVWRGFIRICAKKDYAKALEYYNDNEPDFAVAIPQSTLKFNFDNFVMWDIVFDNLPEKEAVAKMINIFELDKSMTESVILICTAEDGSGHIPLHYPYILSNLYDLYRMQGDTVKANRILRTLVEHRDFFNDYCIKKGMDYDDYINTLDLISQQQKVIIKPDKYIDFFGIGMYGDFKSLLDSMEMKNILKVDWKNDINNYQSDTLLHRYVIVDFCGIDWAFNVHYESLDDNFIVSGIYMLTDDYSDEAIDTTYKRLFSYYGEPYVNDTYGETSTWFKRDYSVVSRFLHVEESGRIIYFSLEKD